VVFFCDDDRRTYLAILRDHGRRSGVRYLAWCLMPNHVHLVAIPERANSLARALGLAHAEYARWINVRHRQVGHMWQNRFHSCPMEERHLWEAIRYVETNPVRAGLAPCATEWCWSSASAHVLGADQWSLTDLTWWRGHWNSGSWQQVLDAGFREAALAERLREATRTGRPFGGQEFIRALEAGTGRSLGPQKRGPKVSTAALPGQLNLGI
jgi:putative transposase